jgi:hypothetical protein
MILDSHSEGSKFNTHSHMCAQFSADSLMITLTLKNRIFPLGSLTSGGFHGGDYDDYHLLGDDAVWLL